MTASRLGAFAFVVGAFLAATAVAQAQQAPRSSPSTAAAAAGTPATASSNPPAVKSGHSTATQSTDKSASAPKRVDPTVQLVKDARDAGFKPQTIGGKLMFCRTAIELGSSFPVRTCYDSDQVKIKIHEYAEERNQLQQMHSTGFGAH